MRLLAFGPRLFGMRLGVSLNERDLRRIFGVNRGQAPTEPLFDPDHSFLYVVKGDHGRCKIGITGSPTERLATLSTGSPFPLQFAWIGAPQGDAVAIEQDAHAMLSTYRQNGEWFTVAPEAAVGAIAAAAQKRGRQILGLTIEQAEYIRLTAAIELARSQMSYYDRLMAFWNKHWVAYFIVGPIIIAIIVAILVVNYGPHDPITDAVYHLN